MTVSLKVEPRESSADVVRTKGMIPAVFYGPKEKATPISIDARAFEHAWKEAGETTIVSLTGIGGAKETLIKDVQVLPTTGAVIHVDFYVLEKGKKVEIAVPLEFTGEAPAEKLGHILVKSMHEIEIEVAPADLPHSLEVDISKLENVGDQITVADVKLPPSAELISDPEEIVASVAAFVEEKEETPEAAPAAESEGAAAAAPAGEASKEE